MNEFEYVLRLLGQTGAQLLAAQERIAELEKQIAEAKQEKS